MAQMARVKQRGDPVEEQLVVGIEAILVSPNFLFRIEKDRVCAPGPVAAKATAGRGSAGCALPERLRTGVAPLVFSVEQHAG